MMDILTVGVFITVFALGLYLFKAKKNFPPGPAVFPIFGSVTLFWKLSRQRPHIVFFEEAKKYGSIMSFKLGNQLVLVLNGYDVINEALVKQADIFSGRATHLPSTQYEIRTGKGIIPNDYGPELRFLRRFTLQALRDFGVGKSSIEEKILYEIEVTARHLDKLNGGPVDVDLLMQNAIGNVIFGIVFGERFEYNDLKFLDIRENLNAVMKTASDLDAFNFLPNLLAKVLSRKADENKLRKRKADEWLRAYINEQIDEHSKTFDAENIRDFIDIYLRTVRENEDGEYLHKGNMFRVILDLFIAGSETTSTTLTWAFLYMAVYPDVQEKCQQEIDEKCGNKVITWSDRDKLQYVMATIMEVQRVASIAPIGIPHCTMKDSTLRGYNIPERTLVITNLYSASMDTKYWEKPEDFSPGRFIGEDGELVKNEALIPFSVGPRVCVGEVLARMELFLLFANLLQRFLFRCESDTDMPSLKPNLYSFTNIPEPFKLRVNNRQDTE